MQKVICTLLSLLFAAVLHAGDGRTETATHISYTVTSMSFDEVLLRISNELQVNAFSIVYEIDIAKALSEVADGAKERSTLKHGISLGFCRPSLSYALMKKSAEMLLYCPFSMVIYQTEGSDEVTVSFLKAPQLSKAFDPQELDRMIEKVITAGLDQ